MRVLYSGFFDLLHLGHVLAIQQAKKPGETLIIHVAPDSEARAAKGEMRPVIPGAERAELVKYIEGVDEVYYPGVYMSDQDVIDATGADVVIRNRGNNETFENCDIRYIARVVPESGLDTTGIIQKILALDGVNYILKRPDGKVLMQYRDNKPDIRCPNTWVFPGGAIDDGEDASSALLREVFEETGIYVEHLDCESVRDITYSWGERNRVFLCKTEAWDAQSNEGKMEWKTVEEVKSLPLADKQEELKELL